MKSIMHSEEFSTSDLSQLQNQLDAWRGQQGGRAPLPAAVWRSAAVLARSLGVSQVSRALRLSYQKLNRSLASGREGPRDWPGKTTFVELARGGPQDFERGREYRAELGEGAGDKLTLHLGSDVRAVVALAESFWRRNR
jgi:hypothetical protein